MKILAIESATSASSVAIGRGGNVAAMALQVDRRGHVGFLVPAIDFCFERAGWVPTDLDAVAVDVGPGPYSGIRAGIAAAQAIAASVGCSGRHAVVADDAGMAGRNGTQDESGRSSTSDAAR